MTIKDNERFPEKLYGRCPLGHNIRPSGETGDNISTTQIEEGEDKPLYWSDFWQMYICKMCLVRVDDEKYEDKFHETDLRIEKTIKGIGIKRA